MNSPLLAWRDPIYILAGISGVLGLCVLLLQPLLASAALPHVTVRTGRRLHRWLGAALTIFVVLHVAALWITSPPDVVDALLLRSPTPFSLWGVIAMWALLGTAVLALARRRFRFSLRQWQMAHSAFVVVIVAGSILHALLIDGTMESASKALLCILVLVTTAFGLRRTFRSR
ncbi:ferric reductase-like transmembrane domain-containing protein [Planktotalea sp.]|uniref:ferric reductase-like transmembrane domain-containing protein n=1 Tax=Planktotalea sp. TaxID=2029877 RepID=UPI003F6B32B6